MTVAELIAKLQEFPEDLKVESIDYASSSGCCSHYEMDYSYDDVTDPYLAESTYMERVPRKKPKTGYDYRPRKVDVVRIDAR